MNSAIRKLFYIFITLLLQQTLLMADEAFKFTAQAPKAVAIGQQFRLEYIINSTQGTEFRLPAIQGFQVLAGPNQSQYTSMQIINGQASSISTLTNTYILLGKEEGTFTIPAASITVKGTKYSSNPVTIKVLPADKVADSNSNEPRNGNTTQNNTAVSSDDIFITATASKRKLYEQESFILTYKIYCAVSLSGFEKVKLPDFEGFHSQEIDLGASQWSLENYNGRNYKTTTYLKYILFPQRAGTLEIASAKFDAVIVKQIQSRDPFEAFFNGTSAVEVKKPLLTPKLTITVDPLPAGKPASYSGAVGQFDITSSINATEIKTNEAITLKLTISGTGNLKLIKNPEIKFPTDFEAYDPKVDNNVNTTSQGTAGTKVIEYLAIPRHAGVYKIPAVSFSYFDTQTGKYITKNTSEYEIKVAKGSGNADQIVANFTNKEDVKLLATDIRFIKLGEVTFKPKGELFFDSFTYYLLFIIPLLLFVGYLILNRKQAIDNANISKAKNRKANKTATKRLKKAGILLTEQNKNAFYEEVLKALWGYLSDKLMIPTSTLSKDNVENELQKYGVDNELIISFLEIINQCEFAQYAPGEDTQAMDKLYHDANQAISLMETRIK